MCHLFGVVSLYTLPLLRGPRGWGDQRETGDPSATWWWASHQQISERHRLSASVAVAAPGPQPWQGPADVTSGEGSFTQAEKEGWDCWVSPWHGDKISVGSAWPCGFLSFWAGICTSRRSCGVDGICNRFIFPGLKILCKLGFYFPFLTAEPRSGGNECVIPLWKHLNRWKGRGRVEREGGESGFRQKSCFLSKNRLKALEVILKLKLVFTLSSIFLCERASCWKTPRGK